MGDVERPTLYFQYCGEINTEKTLLAARNRCKALGLTKVIVASETGRSALRVLDVFKDLDIVLIVVTHYPASTWGPKGRIPIGLSRSEYSETRETLISNGVKIVQSTRPFAPPSRSLDWNAPTPEAIIDKTLEVFGAGTKIAIEAAIIAVDSGEVREGEDVISCAGTFKGLDTALCVRPTYTMNFFKSFEIREIIARPLCRVQELPEHEHKNWKGNLDQYLSQ
ncbi:MAG: hypothetical protein AM326_07095 [Candidatus Thorarchaeota archaeon SMTZ-45]|nr:MAG: hypothetical protein AM325_02665 [Candidatus Thorarchaeota archaeon SMTZ1-45]KXH76377.1 MAG: hypothetical protein AM326_07095 [Candidatus Thorarchaeota archaeon SMTZ-45]